MLKQDVVSQHVRYFFSRAGPKELVDSITGRLALL